MMYNNFFSKLTLMKQAHLTVTQTLTLSEDMMKTAAASGNQFVFGQELRTLGILVVSLLSQEVPRD
jgi:hypothetical protein